MIVGIDASRNRSGGAKAHLIGLLNGTDPREFGIAKVHLWGYKSILEQITDHSWLVKHSPRLVNRSLLEQLFWQKYLLSSHAKKLDCDIILNTDAASISSFSPAVTMSRDMLSYEPGQMELYGLGLPRLRLQILRYIQSASLIRADGAIFLTRYAANIIQNHSGVLNEIAFIPHGVGEEFRIERGVVRDTPKNVRPLECVYVSNAAPYKNQENVIRAIEKCRNQGFDLHLRLIGAGSGRYSHALEKEAKFIDPNGEFVEIRDLVPQSELPDILRKTDIFIFASSCENMPNTLIEAMAASLPIACSDRGPMPEVLGNAGVYFDPSDPDSIAQAIVKLAASTELRYQLGKEAGERAAQYTWERCAMETWKYLMEVKSNKLER